MAFRTLRLILVLTWSIGALGIAAWLYVARIGPQPMGRNSLNISDSNGVTVNYYQTTMVLRENAEGNLEKCINELNGLLESQNYYLLPAMRTYIDFPSPENWTLVRREAQATQSRLDAAVQSAIDYDSTNISSMRQLHEDLYGKEALLARLSADPPDPAAAEHWNESFRRYVERVSRELQALRSQLTADRRD